MTLSLRAARPEEQADLVELQRRASLVWPEFRQQLLDRPEIIQLPIEQIHAGQVIVAERDGGRLGFAVVLPREDGQAELDGLFVEPDVWRGGIGRHLVAWAERYAASLGASSLHVTANPGALAFYEAVGFIYTGEAVTELAVAPTMKKALTP
jgi:GNAT superfamily N-acetyltransferase